MGTQLSLESEIGQGSRFYFSIKLACEQGDPQQSYRLDSFQKVLVVDDHLRNLEIVHQILAIEHIACITASNGIEALEHLKTNPDFVLMILDYHMPYLNGIQQVVEQVRKILKNEALPIIMLHSSEEDALIHKACADFSIQKSMSKPITSHKLFELMTSIQAAVAKKPVEKPEDISNAQVTILVADDNHMNRMIAKAMIDKVLPKARILFVEDGQQAVSQYQQHSPNIVLMDVQMPGMSGYEASRKIREDGGSDDTIIVAFTAGTVKGELERCQEAGMNDYISKPIILDKLQEILHKWITNKQVTETEVGQ